MKPLSRIILSALALAGPATAGGEESVVRFVNDDRLAGTLESLSSDLLVLKSPLLEKPAPFFLKNVVDLSLPASLTENKADHEAVLTLTNGDVVRGQLASVTDEVVSLDTWYAGRMNFNRLMVSGVKIEGSATLLYRGPTGLDGWKQGADKPAWTYHRSSFQSRAAGSIGRDGMLPDECSVSFDVAWKSDSLALKVVLFSDDPSTEGATSGYELYFQQRSITLRNRKTSGHLGSTQSQALLENDKVRIELRASKKSGKICLFVNDRITEVWTDPEVAKGAFGSCLHFVSMNAMPVRISAIAVAPWDGKVERLPEPRLGLRFGNQGFLQEMGDDIKPAPREKPKEGRMELANGDSLTGDVALIQDGMITVKSPLGEIKVPVARLRTIALKKVDPERCIRRNGDIRAWFPDNSSLVFRLDGVGDGTLTGSSQNFGSATFRIAAFNRIEFNIHDVAMEDKRAGDDW
jgi:hypothetical protein